MAVKGRKEKAPARSNKPPALNNPGTVAKAADSAKAIKTDTKLPRNILKKQAQAQAAQPEHEPRKGRPRSQSASASLLAKLDPLLLLAAKRADKEAPRSFDLRPSAENEFMRPNSVSGLPLGVQSLARPSSYSRSQEEVEKDYVTVLVDTRDAAGTTKAITSWRGEAKMLTPTTLVVSCPRRRLGDLAALKGIGYVEASSRLNVSNDQAHLSSRLFVAGKPTVPQTGRGVLVGIVDTGIDAKHAAFRKAGATRIVDYLDQETGAHYEAAAIDAGNSVASPDQIGHGTHVAGIACGNGGGSPKNLYRGVAPEADLAIVKTTFMSGDIVAGVQHIFELADRRGQAAVVNLSLGGHVGAHDGTTVAERTIDQLSGRGRLVVVSAGNEGQDRLHAGTELPRGAATPARWVADFEVTPRVLDGDLIGLVSVQVWNQHEDDLIVRLRAPNGEIFAIPQSGQAEFDRSVFFVQCQRQQAPYSGDFSSTFVVVTVNQPQWLGGWSVIVEEDRSSGKKGVEVGAVHAWIRAPEEGRFTGGFSRSHLVGMPGTAFSAITVASYATRGSWKSEDLNQPAITLKAEDISYFSSQGPTRDGYNKPEIAAPGQWLISALSSTAGEEHVPSWTRIAGIPYAAMQGTSMAAPYVAGALALLLEKDPSIDWAEAKRRLIKSARQDSFTWPCWNSRWGYGKINVERLLTIEP